jgi:hypothetical protein
MINGKGGAGGLASLHERIMILKDDINLFE